MAQKAPTGRNLTGMAAAPDRAQEMVRGMDEFPLSAPGDASGVAATRIAYARGGEPIGHVPPPARLGDKALALARTVAGQDPPTLLDKLGERLAFERSGTRLYEVLVSKQQAYGGFTGGPEEAELQEILDEEYRHFRLLARAVEEAGGDPTAVTPSAHLTAVATLGFVATVTEPRTTLLQSLEVALLAELTDREGWDGLIALAERSGPPELVEQFREALAAEETHLERVRRWVQAGHGMNGQTPGADRRRPAGRGGERTRMNPTQMLKRQHREVESLFRKVERSKDPDESRGLIEEIRQKLELHMRIEEGIFYPAVKELETKKAEEMVNEAYEEHNVVKLVLEQLPEADPEDERFHAKMTVLSELIEHHVEEEEKEMFKLAEKLGEEELSRLGAEMAREAGENGEPVAVGRDGRGREMAARGKKRARA